jgi:hypothetical protein
MMEVKPHQIHLLWFRCLSRAMYDTFLSFVGFAFVIIIPLSLTKFAPLLYRPRVTARGGGRCRPSPRPSLGQSVKYVPHHHSHQPSGSLVCRIACFIMLIRLSHCAKLCCTNALPVTVSVHRLGYYMKSLVPRRYKRQIQNF